MLSEPFGSEDAQDGGIRQASQGWPHFGFVRDGFRRTRPKQQSLCKGSRARSHGSCGGHRQVCEARDVGAAPLVQGLGQRRGGVPISLDARLHGGETRLAATPRRETFSAVDGAGKCGRSSLRGRGELRQVLLPPGARPPKAFVVERGFLLREDARGAGLLTPLDVQGRRSLRSPLSHRSRTCHWPPGSDGHSLCRRPDDCTSSGGYLWPQRSSGGPPGACERSDGALHGSGRQWSRAAALRGSSRSRGRDSSAAHELSRWACIAGIQGEVESRTDVAALGHDTGPRGCREVSPGSCSPPRGSLRRVRCSRKHAASPRSFQRSHSERASVAHLRGAESREPGRGGREFGRSRLAASHGCQQVRQADGPPPGGGPRQGGRGLPAPEIGSRQDVPPAEAG
mmetsp:Transcript_32518/g.58365  ORF Transcript_32518/g.58365 Transcript_32518/m.58365 type:complete len:398 (-) Transcript_32518:213-1406(-)